MEVTGAPTTTPDCRHRQLHAKYGPLLRIAPNEIACADPEAIKLIYRNQGALDKTEFYPVWNNQVESFATLAWLRYTLTPLT